MVSSLLILSLVTSGAVLGDKLDPWPQDGRNNGGNGNGDFWWADEPNPFDNQQSNGGGNGFSRTASVGNGNNGASASFQTSSDGNFVRTSSCAGAGCGNGGQQGSATQLQNSLTPPSGLYSQPAQTSQSRAPGSVQRFNNNNNSNRQQHGRNGQALASRPGNGQYSQQSSVSSSSGNGRHTQQRPSASNNRPQQRPAPSSNGNTYVPPRRTNGGNGQHSRPRPSNGQHSRPRPSNGQHSRPRPSNGQHSRPRPSNGQHSRPRPSNGQHSRPRPINGQHSRPRPSQSNSGGYSPQGAGSVNTAQFAPSNNNQQSSAGSQAGQQAGAGNAGAEGPVVRACSASLECVARDSCDPYTGFLLPPDEGPIPQLDQPTVAFTRCYMRKNGEVGVCCQEPHVNDPWTDRPPTNGANGGRNGRGNGGGYNGGNGRGNGGAHNGGNGRGNGYNSQPAW